MHTLFLILAILVRAAVVMGAAPVRALGEILKIICDKALDPLERALNEKVERFRLQAYAPATKPKVEEDAAGPVVAAIGVVSFALTSLYLVAK